MTLSHNDTRNLNWFRIHYTATAAHAYPPILQAERIVRYADNTGAWVVALWENQPRDDYDDTPTSTCILHIADQHVLTITQHETHEAATNHLLFG